MPKHRGRRRRIAPGVYADSKGIEAEISIGPRDDRIRKGKRFPKGTHLRTIHAWQEETRTELRKWRRLAPARGEHESVRRKVREYLKTLTKSARRYRQCHLLAWVDVFGDRRPDLLSGPELAEQARKWEQAGVAPGTINHRKKCLKAFYVSLYGARGYNPALDVPHRREPRQEARGVPYAWIYEVLDQINDIDNRARLEVMAFTGIPQARLMRVREHDCDPAAGTIYLLPRQKGRGTEGRTFPLTPEGVQACRRFFARGCLGPFSTSSTRKAWLVGWRAANRARATTGQKLLPWIRPYDLRHTFGTWLYEQDGDLNAVAELLDVTIETAKRYAHGAVPARLKQAVARLAERQVRPDGAVRRSRTNRLAGERPA